MEDREGGATEVAVEDAEAIEAGASDVEEGELVHQQGSNSRMGGSRYPSREAEVGDEAEYLAGINALIRCHSHCRGDRRQHRSRQRTERRHHPRQHRLRGGVRLGETNPPSEAASTTCFALA